MMTTNEAHIARLILCKISPSYAAKHQARLFEGWILDIAARVDVYQAAIENSPEQYRPALQALLNVVIETVGKPDLASRGANKAQYTEQLNDKFSTSLSWLAEWLKLYFLDGSGRKAEFMTCYKTLQDAGINGNLFRR